MIIRQSFSNTNLMKYTVRYIYDFTVFVIINLVFLNIIFGIIIDTFAELRDKKKKIEMNKLNICFVCSLDRKTVSLWFNEIVCQRGSGL